MNMDISCRPSVSDYKTIAPINERHRIYLVLHQETGTLFVKKILSIYSAGVYRELQQHPVTGIPRIVASSEEDGTLTVIEEFISGTTLRDKIELTRRSGNSDLSADVLTVPKIGRYMIQLCEILERIHSFDPPVIHRDIKPSNIMVTVYDNVVLLDLNAARYYSGRPTQNADTRLLGTHGYAAPEQYGFRESSPQTDIFSVGRTLKETMEALPYVDHTFDSVIDRCTQMDPSKRYPSAGALKAAIQRSMFRYDRNMIPAITLAFFLLILMITVFFFVLQ